MTSSGTHEEWNEEVDLGNQIRKRSIEHRKYSIETNGKKNVSPEEEIHHENQGRCHENNIRSFQRRDNQRSARHTQQVYSRVSLQSI